MHGNLSLLNLELARNWQEEMIKDAERRQAILHVSNPLSRSRLSDFRRLAGSSLISLGEWLNPSECDLIGDDVWEDKVSINLAR